MEKKIFDFTIFKSEIFLYPIVNSVFNERLRRVLKMVPSVHNNSIMLDIGCNRGYFSNILSSKGTTIGLDIDKRNLIEAKRLYRHIDFIQADLFFMPFRNNSIDLVIGASVLEHIRNLKSVVKQIKCIIKTGGMLIAAYPIEKKLLLTLQRLVNPRHKRLIDPKERYENEFWKVPYTHKQNFSKIRGALNKHFLLIQKDKIPLKFLPDWVSIYECVKMLKL